MNRNKKELHDKFEIKLDSEFNTYKENLLKESKEKIFNSSYETTVKQEIKDFLVEISSQYSGKELISLFNTNKLLSCCYNDWLKWDSPFSTDLEESTFESIGRIITKDSEKDER